MSLPHFFTEVRQGMVSVPRPVVKGAVELGGEWQAVTDGNRAEMRFFRVEVVVP